MSESQIKTPKDFYSFIHTLSQNESTSERSLEEYLRALLLLVQDYQSAEVSFALLAQLLAEAFYAPIAPWDDNWLSYESPPKELIQEHPIEDDYIFVIKMLSFQIADLSRMRVEGVFEKPPELLWFGINRPHGHTWYNFEPATYLECAIAGFNEDSERVDCDWSDLAVLLWLGQIYE